MIAKIAKSAGAGRQKEEGGRLHTHMFLTERTKQDTSNESKKRSPTNRFSVKLFCDENPHLRPSLCSAMIFLAILIGALVVFYFYHEKHFIPCVAVVGASALACCVSIACCCIRRRAMFQPSAAKPRCEEKDAEKFDYLGIEDPLLRKAITHFDYRCCEEAWETPSIQESNTQKPKRVFPVCKTQYQVLPMNHHRSVHGTGYLP